MNTVEYSSETYKEPFWVTNANFVRGRDPLGMQNSSISVYSKLLPGMTNLTLRLRYYGMYLWLLDEYHNLPKDHELHINAEGQYNFIRRAELLLAYLMVNQYENEQSIIGSDYAIRYKNDLIENGYYDIVSGADRINKDTERGVYWAYKSGALGQYYAGSLISLGLIYTRADRFFRTDDKGKDLANAYKSTINNETAKLFLKRILEGKLYDEDLIALDNITLNQNYSNTLEGDFYKQMLFAADGFKNKTIKGEIPSQRKKSIQLFLNLIDKSIDNNSWKDFPRTIYQSYLKKINTDTTDAELGWYYYYLNELVHYTLETVFWAMLMEMGDGKYTIEQFVAIIEKKADEYQKEYFPYLIGNILTIIDSLDDKFETLQIIDEIKSIVKAKETFKGLTKALFALLSLFKDNRENIEKTAYYATNHSLNDKHGNVLEIFQDYIKRNEKENFQVFASKVAHKLINEHINIAYSKMRDSNKNLLKFIIEDGHLVHIETMSPNFTNPRLNTLYNFTKDLNLIENNKLTEYGKEIISQV